jgi:transcriptional regulator GlxA family with amidase domain|tara:strand:- start:2690 stop:3688 length:999 start_codon:yes stop_codon:yes gene_type:complete
MNKSENINIGFLIFPGFPMACLTSMIEPLRAANEIAGQDRFAWQLVSEDGQRVVSSAGVAFEPDCALSPDLGSDVLFLLSGPLASPQNPSHAFATLRTLDRHGAVLGGISGGVFPLVRAGVMEGYRCSVHWCYEAAFRAEFPHIRAVDDVIVTDRRRYTVAGAAAAFDLALRLIEEQLGDDLAHEVACWFQHPLMRGEGVRQRVPLQTSNQSGLPNLVARAVELFAGRMEEPISVSEVAQTLGVSPRQVERAFKKATGQNPTQYYRSLRMKAARQLVLYSKDSMAEIAAAVGYVSATPLLTHYRAAFGVSPHEDRENINAFRVQGSVPLPSV